MKRPAAVLLLALAPLACASPAPPAPPAPTGPVPAVAAIRYVVGGDSRDDAAHVMPWAIAETRARGALAMIFLGDMEHRPDQDDAFVRGLAALAPTPFYPVIGNHDGIFRRSPAVVPEEQVLPALESFRRRFLGTAATPATSVFANRIVYSVDLPGGLHFVALDNVTQAGFGAEQLGWLAADLEKAHAAGAAHVIVGMHKALAGSGVTKHAMDEDGPTGIADAEAARALFEKWGVEIVFASHFHGFAEYAIGKMRAFITGGLGAPLDTAHGRDTPFHHFLQLEVLPGKPLAVEVVRFPGPPSLATRHED
jgi:3',5'-cyclic AMP phosphodiesterase CpdA